MMGWKIPLAGGECGAMGAGVLMKRRLSILSAVLLSVVSAVEVRVATFNVGAHFAVSSGGVSYAEYGLGEAGTIDHESVRAVLGRIDADVVALQEIDSADTSGSPNDVDDLAAALGYAHVYIAPNNSSGSLEGPFDTDLRVAFLSRYPFLSAGAVRSPAGAKELTRLHAVVKVDVPGTGNDPVIINGHLKAGSGVDRFRRAVEMKRLVGHLSALGLGNSDNFIVLGDFNLNPNYVSISYASLPSGLPGSFVLGADLPYPISYSTDPLSYFSSPGAFKLDARQVDGSAVTYPTGAGFTLDLMLVSPAIAARFPAAEIYNSALDTANGGLPKAGVPLASSTSADASDHLAVFADLDLDNVGPYVFTTPGQVVMEGFTNFVGNNDPAPWSTGGEISWRGFDNGSSPVTGLKSYGTGADGSLGFLPGGAGTTVKAVYMNQSAKVLTALRIALDAEQWRSAFNGTADVLNAELVTGAGTVPLPGLSFAASRSLPDGAVAGGATTALETMVTGLAIAPGSSFELRVTFVPGDHTGVAPADVFVNEFHYDNDGGDVGEFVEVAVAPGFTGQLADIDVVFYNGENVNAGVVYKTLNLATDFTLGGTQAGYRVFSASLPANGIQNGPRDGFAIYNKVTQQVLQFVSYEGAFTATSGVATGLTASDIGVSQSGSDPVGLVALGLSGTGGRASGFTWTKFTGVAHSPGQPNAGQTFVIPPVPSQGVAIDNVSVTFLTDTDGDGDPDVTDPDDDNDGQSDADELAFGTDPLDGGSRFAPVIARNGGLELWFPGADGVVYKVERSTGLAGWQELSTHVGSGGPVVVPLPSAEPRMFFRVKVEY